MTNLFNLNNQVPATSTKLGSVKVGSGLSVTSDGTLSASGGGSPALSDVTGTQVLYDINTIYSDATYGNDTTGNGTEILPYATLTKAVSVLSSNKNIFLQNGTFNEAVTLPAVSNVKINVTDKASWTYNGTGLTIPSAANLIRISGNGAINLDIEDNSINNTIIDALNISGEYTRNGDGGNVYIFDGNAGELSIVNDSTSFIKTGDNNNIYQITQSGAGGQIEARNNDIALPPICTGGTLALLNNKITPDEDSVCVFFTNAAEGALKMDGNDCLNSDNTNSHITSSLVDSNDPNITADFLMGINIGLNTPVLDSAVTDVTYLIRKNGSDAVAGQYAPTNYSVPENSSIKDNLEGIDNKFGELGTLIESTIASGSAVSLTTATSKSITSITLTVGTWEVWGNVVYTGDATSVTANEGCVSETDNTLETPPNGGAYFGFGSLTISGLTQARPTGQKIITVNSGTKVVYLVTKASFSGGTLSAYGYLGAILLQN